MVVVGDAYRRALVRDVKGAFNIAADPVIGPEQLGAVLKARPVGIPRRLLRTAADLSWRAHLQPADAGWIDLALEVPLMDVTRAADELGWRPKTNSLDALVELLRGLRDTAGLATPPLDPHTGGPGRIGEFLTGVGQRR